MHTEERIARLEGETGHLAMNAGIEAVRGEIEKLSATLTSGLSPRVRGNLARGGGLAAPGLRRRRAESRLLRFQR